MTRALAGELKKAGFPQHEKGYHHPGCGTAYFQIKLCIPSLLELIEACGDKYYGLIRKGATVWVADGGDYRAGLYGNEFCIIGKTPEEAVAKLYLALHKIK